MILATIQARMGSTRLPGKVLADIGGRPMLDRVIVRARRARLIDRVAVATSDAVGDDPIAAFCAAAAVDCVRGSAEDVLDRYHAAARQFDADIVVRVTADCPLLDPAVVDTVIERFLGGDYDYVSNAIEPTYPDGLDTEVFRRSALDRAWREAQLPSEREHVTPYLWKHPDRFRLGSVTHDPDLSGLRWTVDQPEDLEFVRRIYAHLGADPCFGMDAVLELLRRHPELSGTTAREARNEGYARSLRDDASRKGDASA